MNDKPLSHPQPNETMNIITLPPFVNPPNRRRSAYHGPSLRDMLPSLGYLVALGYVVWWWAHFIVLYFFALPIDLIPVSLTFVMVGAMLSTCGVVVAFANVVNMILDTMRIRR